MRFPLNTDPAVENTGTPYTIKPPEGYLKVKREGLIIDPPRPWQAYWGEGPQVEALKNTDKLTHGKGPLVFTDGSNIDVQVRG